MKSNKAFIPALLLSVLLSFPSYAAPKDTIVLAGGCFWGMEAVFEHLKGVTSVVSGYAGGQVANPSYEQVSTGTTGHAEAVRVTYDPNIISLNQILRVYFTVAHNPTELNEQGPDHGTQYRSEIFYTTPEQKAGAEAAIAQVEKDKLYPEPVVTKVEALSQFYPAEDYHQNYMAQHPYQPYIVINDAPKVRELKKDFPELYKEEEK